MIPFQKIFILVIRTVSRPMLNFIRKQHQINKQSYVAKFFVSFGRKYHSFEHWLNHKILKTTHKKHLTQLKEQILMEKGIQGFYELLFYSIVIGLPLYEFHQSFKSAQKKQQNLNAQIANLDTKMQDVTSMLTMMIEKAEANKQKRNSIASNRSQKITKLNQSRQKTQFNKFLKLIQIQDNKVTPFILDRTQVNKTNNFVIESFNQTLNEAQNSEKILE